MQTNAHLIGLAIRAKLNIVLPQDQFKLDIFIQEDTHVNKYAIDKQINDKERVSSAFEKQHIWQAILNMIIWRDTWNLQLWTWNAYLTYKFCVNFYI